MGNGGNLGRLGWGRKGVSGTEPGWQTKGDGVIQKHEILRSTGLETRKSRADGILKGPDCPNRLDGPMRQDSCGRREGLESRWDDLHWPYIQGLGLEERWM